MTGKEAKEKLKKQYDYRNQYTKDNYDRISVTVPKGTRERIKALLDTSRKETINSIINDLLQGWIVQRELDQDNEGPFF